MKPSETSLTVVTIAAPKVGGLRGSRGAEQTDRIVEEGIPLDKLQQGFARFMNGLQQIVTFHQGRVGDFELDEITFSAEIGADGEFKLLGTGVGLRATSGVSFTLRRQPKAD
jgi:hypothetical protein